jgi:hypothetical protein
VADKIAIVLKAEQFFAGQAKPHLYRSCQEPACSYRNKSDRQAPYKSAGALYVVAPKFSIVEITGKAQGEGLNNNETHWRVA